MEKLKELNQLREELNSKEYELSIEVNLLGDEDKAPLLDKTKKHRKRTEKMIFQLINKL